MVCLTLGLFSIVSLFGNFPPGRRRRQKAIMSVVSLLKLSCDQLLARARHVPFKRIDSWRVTVGLRVAKRDKDIVVTAFLAAGEYRSC